MTPEKLDELRAMGGPWTVREKILISEVRRLAAENRAMREALAQIRHEHWGNGPHCTCGQSDREALIRRALSATTPEKP